jgi:hypothetical protein
LRKFDGLPVLSAYQAIDALTSFGLDLGAGQGAAFHRDIPQGRRRVGGFYPDGAIR